MPLTPSAPPPPYHSDALETARVRAAYALLLLVVLSVIWDMLAHETLDLGVFATLMGGLLAVLGLGAVVRFVGLK